LESYLGGEKSNSISEKNKNCRSGGSAVRASATRPCSSAASPLFSSIDYRRRTLEMGPEMARW
ncbi:hypothetical protein U1Q18_025849, partial [Sarracenia purpurea var. burkii]